MIFSYVYEGKKLLKWLSPFIPFTMEESYAKRYNVPLGKLFLNDFKEADSIWKDQKLYNKWEKIKKIRKVVTGALEQRRSAKEIGSSLEADPILYVSLEDKKILESINFAEICITSNIRIKDVAKLSRSSCNIRLVVVEHRSQQQNLLCCRLN